MSYQNKFINRKSGLTGSPLHQPSPPAVVNGNNSGGNVAATGGLYSHPSSNVVSPIENGGDRMGLQRKLSKGQSCSLDFHWKLIFSHACGFPYV